MSRGAVLSLLRNDSQLAALGGTGFVVVPEYSTDQRPNDAGAYIVICWRTVDFAAEVQSNGAEHFELWAHIPMATPGGSTDFGRIDALFDRCDDIFAAVEDGAPVDGGDGRALCYVGFEGRGIDITDEGPQTICKSAAYFALSSKVSA